jgi:hypothetical protein
MWIIIRQLYPEFQNENQQKNQYKPLYAFEIKINSKGTSALSKGKTSVTQRNTRTQYKFHSPVSGISLVLKVQVYITTSMQNQATETIV